MRRSVNIPMFFYLVFLSGFVSKKSCTFFNIMNFYNSRKKTRFVSVDVPMLSCRIETEFMLFISSSFFKYMLISFMFHTFI